MLNLPASCELLLKKLAPDLENTRANFPRSPVLALIPPKVYRIANMRIETCKKAAIRDFSKDANTHARLLLFAASLSLKGYFCRYRRLLQS